MSAAAPAITRRWSACGPNGASATRRPESGAGLLLDHIGAGRRRIAEGIRAEFDVWCVALELQQRALPERIDDLHGRKVLAAKADLDRLEGAFLRLRRGLRPFEAVFRGQRAEIEIFLERAAGQQRGRCRADRRVDLARARLVQVSVVDPDLLTVADDDLLERLLVDEAEAVGPREFELAAGDLLLRAVRRGDRLREVGAAGFDVAHKGLERVDRVGTRL